VVVDPLVHFPTLPAGAAIADVNDDGFPDLAAANDELTDGVIVLLNNRQRRLGPRVYTTENRPHRQGGGFAPRANGKLEGNVSGAEIGTADFSFQLRAVRASSKQGAYYNVTYTATDSAGNHSSATRIVRVPHDHRDIPKNGPGPAPIP
jgi:hypothetical protein